MHSQMALLNSLRPRFSCCHLLLAGGGDAVRAARKVHGPCGATCHAAGHLLAARAASAPGRGLAQRLLLGSGAWVFTA